ncbi:MAG: dihydrofolate reductase [Nitrosomonadales bacterium]|nr:dihydrofolate reductase [Nitrosomonadales bacterium]
MTPRISIVVAMARNRTIGANNTLPWHLPADLKHFKTLTMGHHIVMGRKTYESIGKPLPGRTSVVVSRNADYSIPGVIVVNSLEAALAACGNDEEIFVIGGAELYRQAVKLADRIYLTEIDADISGDAHFTELDYALWQETGRASHAPDEKNPHSYHFVVYEKKR